MKIKSRQPRKQRKALFKYKNHQRSKLLTCKLAEFVQDEYGIKRIPLRVGERARLFQKVRRVHYHRTESVHGLQDLVYLILPVVLHKSSCPGYSSASQPSPQKEARYP